MDACDDSPCQIAAARIRFRLRYRHFVLKRLSPVLYDSLTTTAFISIPSDNAKDQRNGSGGYKCQSAANSQPVWLPRKQSARIKSPIGGDGISRRFASAKLEFCETSCETHCSWRFFDFSSLRMGDTRQKFFQFLPAESGGSRLNRKSSLNGEVDLIRRKLRPGLTLRLICKLFATDRITSRNRRRLPNPYVYGKIRADAHNQ